MATIKSYTDIEQSRKLAEILPLETADMYWWPSGKWYYIEAMDDGDFNEEEGHIRAWSLAALLNVLPFPQLSKDKLGNGKVGWMVSVYLDDCRYDSCWHDNQIDCCYELILKLYELKQC